MPLMCNIAFQEVVRLPEAMLHRIGAAAGNEAAGERVRSSIAGAAGRGSSMVDDMAGSATRHRWAVSARTTVGDG